MRIKVERLSELHAVQKLPEFWADEGRAGVGSVRVHPEAVFVADGAQLRQRVEGAAGGGAQGGQQLPCTERDGAVVG